MKSIFLIIFIGLTTFAKGFGGDLYQSSMQSNQSSFDLLQKIYLAESRIHTYQFWKGNHFQNIQGGCAWGNWILGPMSKAGWLSRITSLQSPGSYEGHSSPLQLFERSRNPENLGLAYSKKGLSCFYWLDEEDIIYGGSYSAGISRFRGAIYWVYGNLSTHRQTQGWYAPAYAPKSRTYWGYKMTWDRRKYRIWGELWMQSLEQLWGFQRGSLFGEIAEKNYGIKGSLSLAMKEKNLHSQYFLSLELYKIWFHCHIGYSEPIGGMRFYEYSRFYECGIPAGDYKLRLSYHMDIEQDTKDLLKEEQHREWTWKTGWEGPLFFNWKGKQDFLWDNEHWDTSIGITRDFQKGRLDLGWKEINTKQIYRLKLEFRQQNFSLAGEIETTESFNFKEGKLSFSLMN